MGQSPKKAPSGDAQHRATLPQNEDNVRKRGSEDIRYLLLRERSLVQLSPRNVQDWPFFSPFQGLSFSSQEPHNGPFLDGLFSRGSSSGKMAIEACVRENGPVRRGTMMENSSSRKAH